VRAEEESASVPAPVPWPTRSVAAFADHSRP
jgi:hypothetical protein